MLAAILSLTLLGATLGLLLGFASRKFAVETNPINAEIESLLPGTNCGQCGFPGCSGAASAIIDGVASPACCPPGGKAVAKTIAERLGLTLDLSGVEDKGPQIAVVAEEICIGCCRCLKACPTDAIVGAAKQIHNVLREVCTGCEACVDCCPTEAMKIQSTPVSLQHWVWPNPSVGSV